MSFNSAGRRGRRVWRWWKVLWGRGGRYWLTIRRWCLSVRFCVWRSMNHHWNFTCVSSSSRQPPLATLKQLRKNCCAVSNLTSILLPTFYDKFRLFHPSVSVFIFDQASHVSPPTLILVSTWIWRDIAPLLHMLLQWTSLPGSLSI